MASRHSFWAGYAFGVVSAVVAVVVLFLVAGPRFAGPQLAVTMTMDDSVRVGQPFPVTLAGTNHHPDTVTWSSIVLPSRTRTYFDGILSRGDSTVVPAEFFGALSWFVETPVAPDSTAEIVMQFEALLPGAAVLEVQVCNGHEECTTSVRRVFVQSMRRAEDATNPIGRATNRGSRLSQTGSTGRSHSTP